LAQAILAQGSSAQVGAMDGSFDAMDEAGQFQHAMDCSGDVKRPRLSSPQEHEMCVKLLVSPNTASKIIGRGGNEIKVLREHLGIGLHIQGSDNVFPKAPNQQIVVLFGEREKINAAFQTVVNKIVEAEPTPPEAAPMRVTALITQSAVSAIIGTKGATISELRQESGCNISADTDNFAGEQLVHVTGHIDRIPTALALLTPLIEKSGDSFHFVKSGKGMFGNGAKGGMMPGKGIGTPAGLSKGKGKVPLSMSAPTGMSPMAGMQQQVFVADHTPRVAINEERMVMESQTTIAFSIPKEAIGRVLGKGGASSAEIRRLTGAQFKIDPREEDGLVTLSGALHSVHKAHCMVVGRVLSPY